MLAETLEKGAFSHIVINETFNSMTLSRQERAFISRLYLGVLEKLIYIDYVINGCASVRTVKMKPVILNILRIGVYQLLFMDGVPDFAAISESAALASKRGMKELSGFVNGVLRQVQRTKEHVEEGMPENIVLSVPKWIYAMLSEDFGKEAAVKFLTGSAAEPGVNIRLNLRDRTEQEIIGMLEAEGCSLSGLDCDKCFRLSGFDSLTVLDTYRKGYFSVQDTSSVRAALTGTDLIENRAPLIVDVCAAPGGKSICAAQEFPEGRIISRDLTDRKADLIRENAARLGLSNIEVRVYDARVFSRFS